MSAEPSEGASQDVRAAVLEVLQTFNKTSVNLEDGTRFTEDLNFDSLLVMEFIAALEDRLDISVPLNVLPDIETVGQLVVATEQIVREEYG
ncbi:MAG: acyl carrier protein [Rhodospirillaceae bacterium]|nr:acyl carrier protein [Rhodospirillaceae bacterium]